MWTHLHPHPHLEGDLTARSIARNARLALSRSLNLRRLIAMTGSGTTTGYGMPRWSDLSPIFIGETNAQLEACFGEEMPFPLPDEPRLREVATRVRPLIEQLNSLYRNENGSGERGSLRIGGKRTPATPLDVKDDLLAIDLCEAVLKLLPEEQRTGKSRLHLARSSLARIFAVTETGSVLRQLESTGATSRITPESLTRVQEHRLERALLGKSDDSLLKVAMGMVMNGSARPCVISTYLKAHYEETFPEKPPARPLTSSERFGLPLADAAQAASRSVVASLLDELRVSRLLTLNYDVYVEREILRRQDINGSHEIVEFEDLCDHRPSCRSPQARIEISSGLQKGALSVAISADNIGDIVSFAAFSRRYKYQVLHLHGRHDDPDNMVLSQSDYLRIYMQDSVPSAMFREAREALFGGNDILLVGMGTSEQDVMRPFRRFVARGEQSATDERRVFHLAASSHCKSCRLDTVCEHCRRKNDAQALRNFVDFNINTIHYGGSRYRVLQHYLKDMGKALCDLLDADRAKRAELLEWLRLQIRECEKHLRREGLETAPVLLTQSELDPLKSAFKGRGSIPTAVLNAASIWVRELKGRVQSRGLCLEMHSLRKDSERWWEAWRHRPYERRALYHSVDDGVAGRKHYLWMRHCPVFGPALWHANSKELLTWQPIQSLRTETRRVLAERKGYADPNFRNRRVVRVSMPAGGGSGMLVRMLMHSAVPSWLFASPALESPTVPKDGSSLHAAAFIAHVTFSVEFTSVIKALSRFLARQIADLQLALLSSPRLRRHTDGRHDLRASVECGLNKIQKELKRFWPTSPTDFERTAECKRGRARIIAELSTEFIEHSVLLDALRRGSPTSSEIEGIAPKLFRARREAEPRLAAHPECADSSALEGTPDRPHRLDILREVLKLYQSLALGQHDRVFVCLSGIDRVCDQNGDGRNAMHRAFFRLLCGPDSDHDRDPNPPIDLLLISGCPEVPTCYLSEELSEQEAKSLKVSEEKLFSRRSLTGRVLKRWQVLQQFTWKERVLCARWNGNPLPVSAPCSDSGLSDTERQFFDWAVRSDGVSNNERVDRPSSTRNIHRMLWESMACSLLVISCWKVIGAKAATRDDDTHLSFGEYIQSLDRAAASDKRHGIIRVVFEHYARFDALPDAKAQEPAPAAPSDEIPTSLDRLLLHHLALFSLPVEPLVLLGCPLLAEQLADLVQPFEEQLSDKQSSRACPEDFSAIYEWRFKKKALGILGGALDRLVTRGLITELRGPQRVTASAKPQEGCVKERRGDSKVLIYRRFSLHPLLREYLAHHMQLSMIKDGDLDHHQMSLYCDQPRDLPTPTPKHFQLVDQLMSSQTLAWRKTLGAAYRVGVARDRYRRRLWDPLPEDELDNDRNDIYIDAAIRVYEPDEGGVKGDYGEIRAVAQRLRACFSLVRGVFSVGSLSRLDGRVDGTAETPFETYQGWLRGLINAGAGLERNRHDLAALLGNAVFPERPDEFRNENESDLEEGRELKGSDLEEACASLARRDSLETATTEEEIANCEKAIALRRYVDILGANGMDERSEEESGQADPAGHWKARHATARRIEKVIYEADRLGLHRLQGRSLHPLRHPYYRDEIAWLYNERALASLIQGRLFEALPLFEQARFVMRHQKRPQYDARAYHAAERRIELNLAVAWIERGNIARARAILEDLERSLKNVRGSTPSSVRHFAIGYLALCDHLGGSLARARKRYEKVIERFVKSRELRAASVFSRHLADLLAHDSPEAARSHAEAAINAASEAEQRDIESLALVSLASIQTRLGDHASALGVLDRVMTYAKAMGLYRLQADVLLADARLKMTRGEHSMAAETISGAIALSTRYGLRLRKLSSLVLYGEIHVQRRKYDLARNLFEESKSEAERLGYQLQASRAADHLSRLPT